MIYLIHATGNLLFQEWICFSLSDTVPISGTWFISRACLLKHVDSQTCITVYGSEENTRVMYTLGEWGAVFPSNTTVAFRGSSFFSLRMTHPATDSFSFRVFDHLPTTPHEVYSTISFNTTTT